MVKDSVKIFPTIWQKDDNCPSINLNKNIQPALVNSIQNSIEVSSKLKIPYKFILPAMKLLAKYKNYLLKKLNIFDNSYAERISLIKNLNLVNNLIKFLEKDTEKFLSNFNEFRYMESQQHLRNSNKILRLFSQCCVKSKETVLVKELERLANKLNFSLDVIAYLKQGCNRISLIDIR